jgi:hypothetical protein
VHILLPGTLCTCWVGCWKFGPVAPLHV